MKKIFLYILLCFFAFTPAVVRAENFDLNYFFELAKANNIDIDEAMKLPYVGRTHQQVQASKKPFLVVFADFSDLATAAKYVNNGYFVYNNLHGDYGFTAFNVNNPENAALMKKYRVKTVPYLIITNPYRNEVIPVKPALYDNPDRLVRLLRAYLSRTR